MISPDATYDEKFSALNQQLRWEVAAELQRKYLGLANSKCESIAPAKGFYVRRGKRLVDVLVAVISLLVSSPVILVLGLAIAVDSGRPIFFLQRRTGQFGREFVLVKLRTMRDEYDDQGRPLLGEKRVTKMGRLIRRSSLDELLNFWSILKGDMSLIGPRPLVPEYLDRYNVKHRQRLLLKPGLECPMPTRGLGALSYEEQFENDCWYVSNVSLKVDILLALRVLDNVLDRRQNKVRGESSRGSFLGYDKLGNVVTTKNIPTHILDSVLISHGLMEANLSKD